MRRNKVTLFRCLIMIAFFMISTLGYFVFLTMLGWDGEKSSAIHRDDELSGISRNNNDGLKVGDKVCTSTALIKEGHGESRKGNESRETHSGKISEEEQLKEISMGYKKVSAEKKTKDVVGKEPNTKPERRRDILRKRYMHMREVCQQYRPNTTYASFCGHVHVSYPLRLSWCYVPKAGCTFWKKIFYIFQYNSATHKEVKIDIADIGFHQIHSAHINNVCAVRDIAKSIMSLTRTLLITRDPYSRLFSAYVDKFYLPDHWRTMGTYLINKFRGNATEKAKRCGHDVTFSEFLNYVIYIGKTQSETSWFHDDHWHPISKICLPCSVDYKYIAKQESFVVDREFLMEEFGINRRLNTSLSRAEEVSLTLRQTIEAYWAKGLDGGCLTHLELMTRMWAAFQIQGYLPYRVRIPAWMFQKSYNRTTMETFIKEVIEAYSRHMQERFTENKRRALVKAYSKISLKNMRDLLEIYRLDFEMFSYEKEPADLYAQFYMDDRI